MPLNSLENTKESIKNIRLSPLGCSGKSIALILRYFHINLICQRKKVLLKIFNEKIIAQYFFLIFDSATFPARRCFRRKTNIKKEEIRVKNFSKSFSKKG